MNQKSVNGNYVHHRGPIHYTYIQTAGTRAPITHKTPHDKWPQRRKLCSAHNTNHPKSHGPMKDIRRWSAHRWWPIYLFIFLVRFTCKKLIFKIHYCQSMMNNYRDWFLRKLRNEPYFFFSVNKFDIDVRVRIRFVSCAWQGLSHFTLQTILT